MRLQQPSWTMRIKVSLKEPRLLMAGATTTILDHYSLDNFYLRGKQTSILLRLLPLGFPLYTVKPTSN